MYKTVYASIFIAFAQEYCYYSEISIVHAFSVQVVKSDFFLRLKTTQLN